jgi:YegS/Rv2252/BmrU family lipid kinase
VTLKTKLIYNPAAAQGNAGKILSEVENQLSLRNFKYDLALTDKPGHALKLARQAAESGCELIIAAGGDGTINEVINGIMSADLNEKKRPALAVLPVGRGNDFAFGMDIPSVLEEACDLLLKCSPKVIDIGFVSGGDYPEGRYFGNGIGLGFDAVVGFEAAKIKWLHGAASYLVAVIRTIFKYAHAPVYEIDLDGEIFSQAFLMVSIMNGRRMGGSFMMAPSGNPSDATFDLCLAGEVGQIKILPLAATFISGKQEKHPAVRMAQARKISIRAIKGSIPAHADGETLCTEGTQLSVEIIPAALEVYTQDNGVKVS